VFVVLRRRNVFDSWWLWIVEGAGAGEIKSLFYSLGEERRVGCFLRG
jgi:hypothetical protein